MGSMTDKAKGLANEAIGNVKQGLGKGERRCPSAPSF